MAKLTLTNNAPGTRGINLKSGGMLWLEPGQSSDELDEKDIAGELPDLGKPGDAEQAATVTSLAEALAENDDLRVQIDALNATVAEQAEQIATLTAPAKK